MECGMTRGTPFLWPAVRRRTLATLVLLASTLHAACGPVFIAGRTPPGVPGPRARPEVTPRVAIAATAGGPVVVMTPWGPEFLPDVLREAVQKATAESALLQAVPSGGAADLVVRFDASVGGFVAPTTSRVLYNILAFATLMALPVIFSHDVMLTAQVTRPAGGEVRTYRTTGSVTEVHQVLSIFLPLRFALSPERAVREVLEQMIRALYDEMERDGLFARS